MALPILAALNVARKAVPSGVYKALGLVALGAGLGLWFAVRFMLPSPSAQIKYIERVVEAQEPMQEIVVDHAVRETELRIVEKVVEKEVLRYVDRETDPVACNAPIGSVRLLNDARSGELRSDSLQGTPREPDDEGRAPSTITRSDLLESDAGIAIQHNKCRNQLNSLIDWINIQQSSLDQ